MRANHAAPDAPIFLQYVITHSDSYIPFQDMALIRNLDGGWGGASAYPSFYNIFIGFGCGQGFLWSLLYGNGFGYANATSPLVKEGG
jgi:hypothetical protein